MYRYTINTYIFNKKKEQENSSGAETIQCATRTFQRIDNVERSNSFAKSWDEYDMR
jgi:hypothetical protein